jgi:hypothetical protein
MTMKSLLPLCSIPKMATRDGWAGSAARLLLPFYGYWFASGMELTFPASEIVQDTKMTANGIHMTDTYSKAAGVCIKG